MRDKMFTFSVFSLSPAHFFFTGLVVSAPVDAISHVVLHVSCIK